MTIENYTTEYFDKIQKHFNNKVDNDWLINQIKGGHHVLYDKRDGVLYCIKIKDLFKCNNRTDVVIKSKEFKIK